MSWGPPTCISHLIRDGLELCITCECGRVAVPDLKELREAMWRRCGGNDLVDLPRVLCCADCGSRRFTIEHLRAG